MSFYNKSKILLRHQSPRLPYIAQGLNSEERERSFSEMMKLALETAISSSITGIAEVSMPNAVRSDGKYVENSRVIIHKDGKKYTTEGFQIE